MEGKKLIIKDVEFAGLKHQNLIYSNAEDWLRGQKWSINHYIKGERTGIESKEREIERLKEAISLHKVKIGGLKIQKAKLGVEDYKQYIESEENELGKKAEVYVE